MYSPFSSPYMITYHLGFLNPSVKPLLSSRQTTRHTPHLPRTMRSRKWQAFSSYQAGLLCYLHFPTFMLSVNDTFVTKPSSNYCQVTHYYLSLIGTLISAVFIQKPAMQYILESKLPGGDYHVLLKPFGSPYQMFLPSALLKNYVKQSLNFFFFLFHIHQSCLPFIARNTHSPSPSPKLFCLEKCTV